MAQVIDFPHGLPFHTSQEKSAFVKQLKKILRNINVPYADVCCSDVDATALPVSFNSTTGSLQAFNVDGTVSPVDDSGSAVTAITAFAGGGQGSAVALSGSYNEVTVSATAGDSVKLPAAVAGKNVTVKNNGATAIDVFPATGDSINTLAVNTAIRVAPGSTKTFSAVDTTVWEENTQVISAVAGVVGTPAFTFNTQPTNGIYSVSSTQTGFATGGVLVGGFDASGIFTDNITEQTTGSGIKLAKNTIQKRTATAVDVTGSVTAAAIIKGLITSTSAATVTATLDTTANLVTATGAVQGTTVDFIVDNSAGSNVVTVAVGTGMTAIAGPVITGGATLTVASGTIGQFRIYFVSGTVSKIARIY